MRGELGVGWAGAGSICFGLRDNCGRSGCRLGFSRVRGILRSGECHVMSSKDCQDARAKCQPPAAETRRDIPLAATSVVRQARHRGPWAIS